MTMAGHTGQKSLRPSLRTLSEKFVTSTIPFLNLTWIDYMAFPGHGRTKILALYMKMKIITKMSWTSTPALIINSSGERLERGNKWNFHVTFR